MVEAIPKSSSRVTQPDAFRAASAVAAPSDMTADYRCPCFAMIGASVLKGS
jgi:hypothetical protein